VQDGAVNAFDKPVLSFRRPNKNLRVGQLVQFAALKARKADDRNLMDLGEFDRFDDIRRAPVPARIGEVTTVSAHVRFIDTRPSE
jgi:hypothetical protein